MGKCKTKAIHIDSGTFRHNQAYPEIIQAYSKSRVTLAYSESWYIQNPAIFRTRNIQNAGIFKIRNMFRTLLNLYNDTFCKNS